MPTLVFKRATEAAEIEQVCRLNYETFVEEIPQHAPNEQRILVDKFHDENTYYICKQGEEVIGMICSRGRRPFSLDAKLPDLDQYLPPDCRPCEARLLSVKREHRSGRVFYGLLRAFTRHCLNQGYDLAVISGTVRQEKLYRHLGFVPFGPRVGTADALYQPMYLTLETFETLSRRVFRTFEPVGDLEETVNVLPGPVAIGRRVREALSGGAMSHRGALFHQHFDETRRDLLALTGAAHVQILTGSGTLANDVVGGQLSQLGGRGLILSHGEFGERLVDHARRWRMDFDVERREWGAVFARADIESAFDARPGLAWLWAVHCETSTGVLNDLPALSAACAARGVKLAVDAVSALGLVETDLGAVWMASGVSGKALGAFPGLSFVFHNHVPAPSPDALPRYLDLGYYADRDGLPFTLSSNLLEALRAALAERRERGDGAAGRARMTARLRQQLAEGGFRIITPEADGAPGVITFAAPEGVSSQAIGRRLERDGYWLSYNSDYLVERGWLQICLMGEICWEMMSPLIEALTAACDAERTPCAGALIAAGSGPD